MKVLAKKVGEKPEIIEIIDDLYEVQDFVDGYFEEVQLPIANGEIKATLICNENGKISCEKNCILFAHQYYGDLFICGSYGNNYTDIPWDEKLCKTIFADLWR